MGLIPIGGIIVAILFGSALLGMLAASRLPDHHLSTDTRHVVSVSMAVMGTLSALVLGLLISTANASFTAKAQAVRAIAADVIRMDGQLRRYGSDADGPRALLHRFTAAKFQDLFPGHPNLPSFEAQGTMATLSELQSTIIALAPTTDHQRWTRQQALELAAALEAASWALALESWNSAPFPLLVLLIFWFVIIFASFGLFAPRNATATAAILLCAIGVGTSIRMVTELQNPLLSTIRLPGTPMAHALEVIGR